MCKVSGHSGLREDIELRMMAEKAKAAEVKRLKRFDAILDLMNKLGIDPKERKEFIIRFAKWLDGKGN